MNPQNPLCQACTRSIDFCRSLRPFEKRTPHHDDISTFRTSAESGCILCSKLWHYMNTTLARSEVDFEKVYDGSSMTQGSVQPLQRQGCIILMLVFQHTQNSLHRALGTQYDPPIICLSPCSVNEAQESVCLGKPVNLSGLPQNKNTGSSWNCIKSWFMKCREHHRMCQPLSQLSTKEFTPTRLVHIRDNGKTATVIYTVIGSRTEYIALSYCWGKDPILKLEQATQSKLYGGTSARELPKTYQDAMLIAHKLGINHIWIDALCIQQDDAEDWLRESAVMHNIYGNAVLTISATSSSKANGGLFSRTSDYSSSPVLSIASSNGELQNYLLDWVNPAVSLVTKAPVSQRGWILQEKLLSRRFLHFADEQLFWECNELVANERFYEGFEDTAFFKLRNESTKVFSSDPDHVHSPTPPSSHPSPSTIWSRIISEYTSRHLTNESDKLPALSGLASRFKQRIAPFDQYLAGLWRSHLPLHLLWEADNAKISTRPMEYIAPTWSPMSLVAKVVMLPPSENKVDLLVDLPDADTTKTSANDMGAVCDGYIRPRCRALMELSRIDDAPNESQNPQISGGGLYGFSIEFGSPPLHFTNNPSLPPSYEISLDPPLSTQPSVPTTANEAVTISLTSSTAQFSNFQSSCITNNCHDPDHENLYFLPISTSKTPNPDETDWTYGYEVQGLILQRMNGSSSSHSDGRRGVGRTQPAGRAEGVYQRIGLLKAYGETAEYIRKLIGKSERDTDGGPPYIDSGDNGSTIASSEQADRNDSEVASSDEDARYIITIV